MCMVDRIITTGMSGIWRNKNSWLHLNKAENPVLKAGNMGKAKNQSVEKARQGLFDIRLKIMIYEAQPDKYESLDDIKI